MFYADDGHISERKLIWVQGMLTTFIWLFEKVGIDMNLGKNKSMTCMTSFIGLSSTRGQTSVTRRRRYGYGGAMFI